MAGFWHWPGSGTSFASPRASSLRSEKFFPIRGFGATGIPRRKVEEFLRALREAEFLVRRWPRIQVVREDPADDQVLACALAAKAYYIVSKDEHLQKLREYQGIRILPTEVFLTLITGE
jgi:predicted nucleic acid-binding protein